MAAQAAQLNTNTRYLHPKILNYAERLTATLPDPLSVCYFCCSGSEANELAIRLARTFTGRKEAIVLGSGYHGNTSTLIDHSPYKCEGPGGRGLATWVKKAQMPDPYRGPYKGMSEETAKSYAGSVNSVIEDFAADGRAPGFFIAESVLGVGGQVVLPPGYLQHVYACVRGVGGLTIADEVQVGFGRVGSHMWAFETQGVVPDIVTLGKPIGNGHPLACVITRREIAEAFDNGMEYFNSFGGNPVSAAVGIAVLDIIDEEELMAKAEETGNYLMNGLRDLSQKFSLIGDVRGLGLFVGLELVRDRETLEPASKEAKVLVNKAKDLGVLLSTDGPDENVIKMKPPMVFGKADADILLATLDQAFASLASA